MTRLYLVKIIGMYTKHSGFFFFFFVTGATVRKYLFADFWFAIFPDITCSGEKIYRLNFPPIHITFD